MRSSLSKYEVDVQTAMSKSWQSVTAYDSDFGLYMLERVEDPYAMRKYFLGLVANDNRMTNDQADLIPLECDFGLRYGREERQMRSYLDHIGEGDRLIGNGEMEKILESEWERAPNQNSVSSVPLCF